VYFHAGGGDIFCSAAETGAVIRAEEIVVYGFGNAHNAAFVSGALHISADFGAGVHGIVAAIIEEIPDIVFFEYLKNPLIVGIIHIRVFHFVSAGTKLRRRSVCQQAKLIGVFLAHIVEFAFQHAFYSVCRTVNLCDFLSIQRGAYNAVCAGVYHGGRASGLTKYTRANKFFAHSSTSN